MGPKTTSQGNTASWSKLRDAPLVGIGDASRLAVSWMWKRRERPQVAARPGLTTREPNRRYLHPISSPADAHENPLTVRTLAPPAPPPRAEILGIPLAVSDYEQVIDWVA